MRAFTRRHNQLCLGQLHGGPAKATAAIKGIATNPGGSITPSELGWMASPVIDLTGFGNSTPVIQWWDWKHIESATFDWRVWM
jgi:hypothetical protein